MLLKKCQTTFVVWHFFVYMTIFQGSFLMLLLFFKGVEYMYKFLGYMKDKRRLGAGLIDKVQRVAEQIIEEKEFAVATTRYMTIVSDTFSLRGIHYKAVFYYYENFEKLRVSFYNGNEKEVEIYLKRQD